MVEINCPLGVLLGQIIKDMLSQLYSNSIVLLDFV